MSENSPIEWTDHTFNPWWGCVKVSDGCTNCYAERDAARHGQKVWGPAITTDRRLFSAPHWENPRRWNFRARQMGQRKRVFCASMADVFEQNPALDVERQKLWHLIEMTTWLEWQLLTKRPENVLAMVPDHWRTHWPAHAWIGTSVEHQLAADLRIPRLLEIPARVRFLSAEPLLGPLDLGPFLQRVRTEIPRSEWPADAEGAQQCVRLDQRIHWLIVGGESGGPAERRLVEINKDPSYPYRYRPTQQAAWWVHSLQMQARAARVAFFFKQWGGPYHGSGGREIDGLSWSEFPRDSLPLPSEVIH